MTASRAVLLTGAASSTGFSSGTGHTVALKLHRAGWPVYATARSAEALKPLQAEGITTMVLDVTDEDSMVAAVDRITEEHGAVGVLINNAAYSLNGTVWETPLDAVRRQFETNVFGLIRMTQLVLPGMREQGQGRIVLMSSMFGHFATPGRGFYQATKHSLGAIGDSLRNEVGKFGIKVSLIEPSPIRGGFVPTNVGDLGMSGGQQAGLYKDFWEYFVEWHGAYREVEHPRGRGRTAVTREAVAGAVMRAVTDDKPRIRYRIGFPAKAVARMRWTIGDRGFERFLHFFFPMP
jgi:NAD(P)-dependent dehydrogenase (short-subunit alcohol dehydrogenase family)